MDPDKTNILVVDDLPEKVLVYETILEELGQNLVVARSGPEALRQVLDRDFAVILLDVNMPGMDGLETAALIRQRKKSSHTPIIFVTAFADEVRAAEGYAHGAVDYILAPVVPEVLRAKVRVFVDLYRMARQVERQAEERVALAEERSKRAAAEEANRRLHFLSEVSRALADSLDPETSARTVARHAVPFLADLAGVTLAGATGEPWVTELAWAGAGGVEAMRLAAPEGPHDALRDAVERALADGRPETLDRLDIAAPLPGRDLPERLHSAMVLPLRARGRTLGVLTLAFGPSERAFDPSHVALADDLASRAATALDNARLYRDVERADRQKNEFLSMLAHELRNPLAPIRNAVEVLRAGGADGAGLDWARGVIERQVSHLVRLVDDLLDVSRITSGKIRLKREPVELAAVLAQAVEASRPEIESRRHSLEVTPPDRPLRLHGDPARLAQVFTNLLNNAAKYTEPGGRVWLTATAENGDAVVRVRDTGIGIPREMLADVFEPFLQVDRSLDRSQGGLGIGLTLVKRLVGKHGGTVEAHSEGPGKGSEFVVRLPLEARSSHPGVRGDEPPALAGTPAAGVFLGTPEGDLRTPQRVLVVDDNRDGADSLGMILRLSGYDVRLAHDGPEALAAAASFRPQVVVLDIGLPGMDGYEVARRLRADSPARDAVLVAVTGYGRSEDRARSRESGFDHHLVKPVDLDALARVLAAGRTGAACG
jgi:signal transduction histidine kinase/DNA-binding response OmpR family regulator